MAINLSDKLTADYSENYIMSIRLRSGGLSFSAYSPSVNESFFYRDIEFDRTKPYVSSLKECFFENDFLTWFYKQVNVVCVTPQYTLVPKEVFQEKQKVDSCIKEKRRQIEFDLPRLVYAISQEIQMTHDVISILERHKDNFSPYLNEEIAITIADMRTGNYEAAITRFEGRIGSTNLSEVCRGFIQMIRGDDTSVYWETLSVRFEELQRQHLRSIALKIPPKVHRLSFFLMMCMMLLYVVVLGWELISNMGILFG